MTPPAKTSPTKTADARRTALAVLRAVLDDRRPLDEALTGNAHFTKLETRDRAFCRLLLTTVLRRLGQIDDALDRCLDRPIRPKDYLLRHILRLRSKEHTSELQSIIRNSYAVFGLKKQNIY